MNLGLIKEVGDLANRLEQEGERDAAIILNVMAGLLVSHRAPELERLSGLALRLAGERLAVLRAMDN